MTYSAVQLVETFESASGVRRRRLLPRSQSDRSIYGAEIISGIYVLQPSVMIDHARRARHEPRKIEKLIGSEHYVEHANGCKSLFIYCSHEGTG